MNADRFCDGSSNRWFALRVKPRFEKSVSTSARNKGYEEFLPLYQCRRRWSDRFQSVELPLFPGYVFCQLNPEFRLPLLSRFLELSILSVSEGFRLQLRTKKLLHFKRRCDPDFGLSRGLS